MSQLLLITVLVLLSNIYLSLPTTLEEQFIQISQTRHKRQLTYPYGSAIGMYLAFAVPLDLPEQDVLFSYNFEANYNLPNNLEQYALNSITSSRRTLRNINRANVLQYIENFLNRKIVFEPLHCYEPRIPQTSCTTGAEALKYMAEYVFKRTSFHRKGLHGRSCLLRTICEVKQSHLSHNGILGHIINIIFIPSTTVAEKIDEEFKLAEKHAEYNVMCSELYTDCKYSLLDLISVFDN